MNVSNGIFVFLPAVHHASTHTREIIETASTIFSLCPMSTGSNAVVAGQNHGTWSVYVTQEIGPAAQSTHTLTLTWHINCCYSNNSSYGAEHLDLQGGLVGMLLLNRVHFTRGFRFLPSAAVTRKPPQVTVCTKTLKT